MSHKPPNPQTQQQLQPNSKITCPQRRNDIAIQGYTTALGKQVAESSPLTSHLQTKMEATAE